MAVIIFRSFVKRAATVMSSTDFTALHFPPLSDDTSLVLESAPFKLVTASNALLTLYNGGSDSRKSLLLELVKEDQLFVCNSVRVACKVLKLHGKSMSELQERQLITVLLLKIQPF